MSTSNQLPPPPANASPIPGPAPRSAPRGAPTRLSAPTLLILLGLVAAFAALPWSNTIRDDAESERGIAEMTCLLGREEGRVMDACFADHAANYTGPIILAVAGAFVVLCGVIMLAGRRSD